MQTNTDIRTHCQNIFSDNKATRTNARAVVISHTHLLPHVPTLTNEIKDKFFKPIKKLNTTCEIVSYAVSQFIQADKFIFKVKNKAGVIDIELLKNKNIKIRNSGVQTTLPVNSDQPTYLVTMLHTAGRPNIENKVQMLFEEGFGTNTQDSLVEAAIRLQAFIGVNYCHSIIPEKNRPKKQYIIDLMNKPTKPNVSYEAFCWTADWTFNLDNNSKSIPQVKVKRLFRLLMELNPHKATMIYDQMIKPEIPFQDLRQTLVKCISLNSFVISFRKDRLDRPLVLVTADDDGESLRNDGLGQFSHYDELIETNPNMKVATSGYYMVDPENNSVEIITKLLLTAKRASYLRPNLTYLPEPNIVIKIPAGNAINPNISFIRINAKGKHDSSGGNLESIGLLENLGLMKGDVRDQIIIGKKGAIQTGLSPNVKDFSKFTVEPQHFLQLDILKRLRSFSQSPVHPRNGFAMNISRTFPSKTNVMSEMCTIYKAFDPIHYAKEIPTFWFDAYLLIAQEICHFYHLNITEEALQDSAQVIVKTLNLSKNYTTTIAEFIKEKISDIREAQASLKNTDYSFKDFEFILQSSVNINVQMYEALKELIDQGRLA